ncbi:hypothetical protein M406DRAFT_340574 [Cryphonectria parasitica EP155]|uniref:A to I editase domain-containing protein n=1 Tax=Cryphonectria parasitica (strain ATCC 38755 / EP155) TaxID=660469 RepID=A0A9P5CP76_CRYP1|nr:uncharacterized protein M406DRAFT_340574 [Cryphonectria parasitica EP155]KAF3765107.1 hypothetical protein M406DRAFT_340574 [Cryphonectria parasitica EP155]
MTVTADAIASTVLKEFNKLSAKRKPQNRGNGAHEWVPLAGIVARHADGSLRCLALATGMKCLPVSKLPLAEGRILHDWHAEVLALRALNHFILEECRALLLPEGGKASPYIRRRTDPDTSGHNQPFVWAGEITLHMYCSEAPCGDASMELVMSAQEDAAPWEAPLSSGADPTAPDLLLLGRACFSHLGVVRRKPARPDAPPTLSKSCSDKLALKQCTSLLNSLTSLLVSPQGIYLDSLVLPESQFSETACQRCFSHRGRMAAVTEVQCGWTGGYQFWPFETKTTALEFDFSRRVSGGGGGGGGEGGARYVASNLATAWTANGLVENIVGGVLQGRKQTDPRGGSKLNREGLWHLAQDVAIRAGVPEIVPHGGPYKDVKDAEKLAVRRRVKEDVRAEALKGWVRNVGDEDHFLDV